MDRSDKLLIIIPAYNEQGAIYQVVNGVRQATPEADVLVIDDGSVDNTALEAEAAGALVLQHPFNLGIGGAVQTGLKFAREHAYDYVIRLDGDGQHNAEEILLLINVLRSQKADMVIGSRFLETRQDWHIPWARRLGISFFGWAVSLLIGNRATDTTSGFCGMNRRAVEVLAAYLPQDYPDVESRVIIHKAGLRQVELPVHMRARMAGVSSINAWRSIYYACKVTLAMVTSALKDIAPAEQKGKPGVGRPPFLHSYLNGNGNRALNSSASRAGGPAVHGHATGLAAGGAPVSTSEVAQSHGIEP
ncbi:MAG TPA: glycosyltransferase family 2 protein [Caldilineaceae bacterium]|nr:glycosyltransferase family 2 protein [Caldilineaceae bacterium]